MGNDVARVGDTAPLVAPRRLHPAGIAVLGVGSLRELAVPLAVAFATAIFGAGGQPIRRALVFAAMGALVAVIAGCVRWMTTRWSIGDGSVRLRTGLLSTKEIDVPLSRVQAIDTVHGPLQRLFGVRGVQIQTAGGSRAAEIVLPALSPVDVELLRDVLRGRTAPMMFEAAPVVEHRLGRGRLVLAALTSGQVGVLVPLLAVVLQLGESLWGDDLARASRTGTRFVPDSTAEWLLTGLSLVVVAWLVSTVGAMLSFAGFTITRDGDRLRVRRGLISQREATIPVARVQAVRVVEGVLRAPFGLATVRAEVAGYAREASVAQTLFPLLRVAEVEPFLAAVLPEMADGLGGMRRPPRRALRRYVLPPVALLGAVGGAAYVVLPGSALLVVLLPMALAAVYGAASWRTAGWRLDHGRIAIRSRRLAVTTVLAPVARLQQHGTRQTLLQRRAALADIEIRVGAATLGHVRHLEATVAGALFDGLGREGVTTPGSASPPPGTVGPQDRTTAAFVRGSRGEPTGSDTSTEPRRD